ncbi:uncharacterized protein LOC120218441 [Hibiscus syriacus]|uniref:uncharacterized protein LOC120218441 n=1 Tax=Hibiscus syriacus TaxID=106335 RepID=UPI0019214C8E|nr:uncharacterized protein LOC120218441 [Hibiscus syriacus]
MIKPSGTRNQRCKGVKVKHVLQICGMLALCIWLLHQFRSTYDHNAIGLVQTVMSGNGALKLGRKDLDPRIQVSSTMEIIETGEVEAEDDKRGSDQEKSEGEESEEVEDLIDEEDTLESSD